MSSNQSPAERGIYYHLDGVSDDDGLARACETLKDSGVGVLYGAELIGDVNGQRGGYEVKVRPPLEPEKRLEIAQRGVRLLLPHAA